MSKVYCQRLPRSSICVILVFSYISRWSSNINNLHNNSVEKTKPKLVYKQLYRTIKYTKKNVCVIIIRDQFGLDSVKQNFGFVIKNNRRECVLENLLI